MVYVYTYIYIYIYVYTYNIYIHTIYIYTLSRLVTFFEERSIFHTWFIYERQDTPLCQECGLLGFADMIYDICKCEILDSFLPNLVNPQSVCTGGPPNHVDINVFKPTRNGLHG